MKHACLTLVVIALMTSAAFAQDGDAPESVDLKLSKTLTLNPSGSAPAVDKPTAVVAPPATIDRPSSALPWGLLALLVLPIGYWLGKRQQQDLVNSTLASQSTLSEQVTTLKDALMETGSGPRNEWQSTLTSLQSEVREKNKYIDGLHDQTTANTELLAELEGALQQQVEATESLETEHQTALAEEVGKIQEQLDSETKKAAQKLEQQAQQAKQTLEEQGKNAKQSLEIQSTELNERLEEQSATAKQHAGELESSLEQASAERDKLKTALEERDAELGELRQTKMRLDKELESAVAELQPHTAQIKQLASELDELQTSNDASVAELKRYVQQNTELSEQLATAHEDKRQASDLLEQEKTAATETLDKEKEELGLTFENEKRALAQSANQKEEQLNRTIEKLEESLKDREESLKALEAETQEKLANEQTKFAANLEAEKTGLAHSAEKEAESLNNKIQELELALEEREDKLKTIEADFAHTSELSNAALEDRESDLAALVEKLASHTATETALDELNLAHSAALAQLQANTEHVTKLEGVLQKSKTQLDQLETVQAELSRKDAELAQVQAIAVDTEQALNEARTALSDQARAHEDTLQSSQSAASEVSAKQQEVDQLNAQLASKIEVVEQETRRANEAQAAKQALEDKLIHQEQDTALLLDNLKALEAEHERQNQMMSMLESSVEQLEADLNEREEENTHTLKQLALVSEKSAELEAKAENSDLLDTHIQELEAQLVSEQEQRNDTTATQKFLIEEHDLKNAELEQELKTLKLTVNNQAQANEHLKKTLEQARKYREELEENTKDLERENRELSKTGTRARQELQVADEALQESSQKISEREQKLQDLQTDLDSKSGELASSKAELASLFVKVDELTASVALMESNSDDANTRELSDKLDRTRKELNHSAQRLSDANAARDEQERNVSALTDQLAKSQEQLEQKKERANTLGAQLIELSEQRDKHLDTIAKLQESLDATPPAQAEPAVAKTSAAEPDEDYEQAMRARENIIAALEHELQNADIKIAGLNQKLEDSQIAVRAESRVDKPAEEPISAAELEKLKLALMEKTRRIQALSNDVKVNKDLVKVFENDSNMLHDTEVKLETLEEHSQFLEHELAKAVTENKTLKSEIEKAAKRLARHQNIGRTVSEDTRLEQMRSRLSLLENENRQQLKTIAQLRGGSNRTA